MNVNELIQDISLMVRGSMLPSKKEIADMTLEEKEQLEVQQDQIIKIFQEQALLNIWETKIKITRLIQEVKELRSQIIQKQNASNSKQLVYSKTTKIDIENIKRDEDQNNPRLSNTLRSPRPPNQRLNIGEKKKRKNKNERIDFIQSIPNKTSAQVNSQKDKGKVKNNLNRVKYVQPFRRRKTRTGFFDFS